MRWRFGRKRTLSFYVAFPAKAGTQGKRAVL